MTITRICLVRHGETAWNAEGRVQGQLDVPLSEVGHAQARAAAAALAGERFAALYSSDLARARQTAAPAARRLALPVRLEPALRERHYGAFESLTYVEVRERYPAEYARFKDKDPEFDFVSGESLRRFAERAVACVAELARRHAGESILVVTHGGVLEMAFRHATARGLSSPRDFELPNAGLNRIEAAPEGWRVLQWADVSHLQAARDDLAG
ncbi:MAG TPA: histidine phosphatase family protein [Burkholderiales bacterium]|nr:histidine phosphatase family protein [Burkholderiales bacterium]